MHILIMLLMAIVAGAVLPIQAGLNTQLGRAVENPVYGALLSFVVGTIGLIVYGLLTNMEFGKLSQARSLPWWMWLGGLMGAFYVVSIIVLAPRLGTALTFGLTIAAQMLFSLLMDHYGWLEIPTHTINWQRVAGVVLIIGGVLLIRSY